MDWSSGDLPCAWKAFKQHCEFTFCGPLKQKSEEVKCNYLMLWVGDKGREIYSTWELGTEEAKKLNTYYTKYEAYVKPKSNRVFARYKFRQKVQQEGEPFEQFLTDLKLLVKDCGYCDPNEMVRDRVVIGCHSTKTREKLIQEGSDLTLEKAIDIARTDEISKTQLETMASEDASNNSLNQRKQKPEQTRKQKHDHTQKKEVPSKECQECGYKHGNNKCYAKGKRCTKCQKLNHFARVCRSKSDARKGVLLLEEDDSDHDLFVGCITSINTVELSEWYEELTVQNKAVKFQLDTGPKYNVLPHKVIEDLGIQCHVEKTQIH